MQAERIIDIKSRVDGQTVLTKATDYATSAVTTGGANKYLKKLMLMMKQLTCSFTSQASTLTTLSIKKNIDGGGGGGQNTKNKKALPVLHVCEHCKKEVYHK